MPRLLAFLPCERAIIAKDDETVSLINLIHGFDGALPSELIGQNVMLPLQWAILAYWLKEDGDEDVTFEQQIELFSPNGTKLFSQLAQFSIAKFTHSHVARLAVLPVQSVSEGRIRMTLRLSLRRLGTEEFQHVTDVPIDVSLQLSEEHVAQ